MPDVRVQAWADDATGALEVGARFADEGVLTSVSFIAGGAADALVVDTEMRHAAPGAARARACELAAEARRAGVPHVYQKTDSTLRGPIAGVFAGLLAAWPERALVYAPAYPALGRTVRGGVLLVDGRPLAETAFAQDHLNPAREGSLTALLGTCGAPVTCVADAAELQRRLARGAAGAILVCDGRTEADVEAVAAVLARASHPVIAAGPAALARPWIRALRLPRHESRARPRVRRCLVVSGSVHPASREQAGTSAVEHDAAGPEQALACVLAERLRADNWAVLAAGRAPHPEPAAVAAHAARVVRLIMEREAPDTLVVFGGDTTFALLRELGVAEAVPCTELLAGIPLSLIRWNGREIALVTKAGGFGGPGVLAQIREKLGS